jgi:cytoskeletal protein RodZ
MTASIGQQLRTTRETRRISLEQVSQATRIRVRYLQALEAGDLGSLPSQAQARGFLRAYGDYLGLNSEELMRQLDGPPAQDATANPPPEQPAQADRPVDPPEETQQSERIFKEIGQDLRRQRELLGLTLEDVARHTHLRAHYLAAFEAGDMNGLPSPVQGRGMLSNYASFLGLDPEPLLLRFADGLQAGLAARQVARGEPITRPVATPANALPPGKVRRRFSSDLLIGILLVVALGAFVLWGAIRIFSMRAETEVAPTSQSIADILLITATPTLTPTLPAVTPSLPAPAELFPTAVITDVVALQSTLLAGGGAETVAVYVTVRQRTWMRVTVDGQVVFQGRVLPGSAYAYEGNDTIEILTGNGGGLQLFYNQQDLGIMGEIGQIVQRIFTREGVLTPTPTLTPETTPSPLPTATVAPTNTLPPGFFPVPTVPSP